MLADRENNAAHFTAHPKNDNRQVIVKMVSANGTHNLLIKSRLNSE